MNKSRIRNKITKQSNQGIVHVCACLKFLWVTQDPLGGPGTNLCPLALAFSSNSRVSRRPKKLFPARISSSLPPQKVSIISVEKCAEEKYFCQVVQFGTNIALYVKCSKMRLYISSRGHFKQLWKVFHKIPVFFK